MIELTVFQFVVGSLLILALGIYTGMKVTLCLVNRIIEEKLGGLK